MKGLVNVAQIFEIFVVDFFIFHGDLLKEQKNI